MGIGITITEWWMLNEIPVLLGNITGGMIFTGFALYFTVKK